MRGMNNVCICAISFELLRIWQDESFLLSQPGFIKPTHATKAKLNIFVDVFSIGDPSLHH